MGDCDEFEVPASARFDVPASDNHIALTPEDDEILRVPDVWLIVRPGC